MRLEFLTTVPSKHAAVVTLLLKHIAANTQFRDSVYRATAGVAGAKARKWPGRNRATRSQMKDNRRASQAIGWRSSIWGEASRMGQFKLTELK